MKVRQASVMTRELVAEAEHVQGNTLHRIGDVLQFDPVNVAIGFHTRALSFQRGYFPIFQFFSSDLILKSTLHSNIK